MVRVKGKNFWIRKIKPFWTKARWEAFTQDIGDIDYDPFQSAHAPTYSGLLKKLRRLK